LQTRDPRVMQLVKQQGGKVAIALQLYGASSKS
jgi:hypothetical protein